MTILQKTNDGQVDWLLNHSIGRNKHTLLTMVLSYLIQISSNKSLNLGL